jgi:hypothetical protein
MSKQLARVEPANGPAWIRNPGGTNHLLLAPDESFFISYQPLSNPSGIFFFASDNGSPETAIVQGQSYYILNGDFRYEYERLVPQGFAACKAFYDSQKSKNRSSWSTEDEDANLLEKP